MDVPLEFINQPAPVQAGMGNTAVYFYLDRDHQGHCNANLLFQLMEQYEGQGIYWGDQDFPDPTRSAGSFQGFEAETV